MMEWIVWCWWLVGVFEVSERAMSAKDVMLNCPSVTVSSSKWIIVTCCGGLGMCCVKKQMRQ